MLRNRHEELHAEAGKLRRALEVLDMHSVLGEDLEPLLDPYVLATLHAADQGRLHTPH